MPVFFTALRQFTADSHTQRTGELGSVYCSRCTASMATTKLDITGLEAIRHLTLPPRTVPPSAKYNGLEHNWHNYNTIHLKVSGLGSSSENLCTCYLGHISQLLKNFMKILYIWCSSSKQTAAPRIFFPLATSTGKYSAGTRYGGGKD